VKLASRLAEDLSQRIVEERIGAGEPIGSEAEIAADLGVSRWSAREALNILEQEGRINVRRGRHGGVFVAEPNANAISLSLRTFFEFTRVTIEDILEARAILDELALKFAIERVTSTDIAALRSAGDLDSTESGLQSGFIQYEALLDATDNRVLATLIRAVGQLGMSAIARSTLSDAELTETMRNIRLHRKEQIEAVIAGDLGAALAQESRVLEATRSLLQSARLASGADIAHARLRALYMFTSTRRFKRPELLMHEIVSDIVAMDWPIGGRLGGEADLLIKYQVSRSTFREAVRALERIGVVEMKTGRHSGLTVALPNSETVVNAAARQFADLGVTRREINEVALSLAARAASVAALKNTPVAYADAELNTLGDGVRALVRLNGNKILALFADMLTHQILFPNNVLPKTDLTPLARAIENGDGAAAARFALVLYEIARDHERRNG
jgi:DNA-binding FadR family transcriptional regulator